MASQFFPFIRAAYDNGSFVQVARDLQPAFLAGRPPWITSWFAYDAIIHSPTKIEFVVYDMARPLDGGIGKEIGRFTTEVDANVTHHSRLRHARELAEARRHQELMNIEEKIISRYAEEMFE